MVQYMPRFRLFWRRMVLRISGCSERPRLRHQRHTASFGLFFGPNDHLTRLQAMPDPLCFHELRTARRLHQHRRAKTPGVYILFGEKRREMIEPVVKR
jgi:hypothetical protein